MSVEAPGDTPVLRHLRGTGPWRAKGFNLMSLFLSSFTPTPEAPVHKGATHHRRLQREKPQHKMTVKTKLKVKERIMRRFWNRTAPLLI